MPQMVWTTTPLGSHDFFNQVSWSMLAWSLADHLSPAQNWYDFTGLEPEQSLGLGWQSPFHEGELCLALSSFRRV